MRLNDRFGGAYASGSGTGRRIGCLRCLLVNWSPGFGMKNGDERIRAFSERCNDQKMEGECILGTPKLGKYGKTSLVIVLKNFVGNFSVRDGSESLDRSRLRVRVDLDALVCEMSEDGIRVMTLSKSYADCGRESKCGLTHA